MARSKGTSTRHTDAAFNKAERESFLAGMFVGCRSSNVLRARWDEQSQTLHVVFKDGTPWTYSAARQEAEAFARAPSKQGFLWDQYISAGEKGSRG